MNQVTSSKLSYASIFTLLIGLFAFGSTHAQGTFGEVVTILQSNCASSSCHGGSSPSGGLDLTGSAADVYSEIVGVTPNSTAAIAAGYKLIDPAYPRRSFLFKKINNNLDPGFALSGEGDPMPVGSALSKVEREIIRQWIQYGAPQTGTVVDKTLIEDYYTANGLPPLSPIAAPDPAEGFQIHHGPIFLEPGGELETLRRFLVKEVGTADVDKFQVHMNEESHHFIIYDYFSDPSSTDDGIEEVNGFFDLLDITNAAEIGVWQFDYTQDLPDGTAYRWPDNNVLNLNYHIANYNPDSILAAEVYINVYTKPLNTEPTEMIAGLTEDPFLVIPNDGNTHTFEAEFFDAGSSETWNLWILQAHTHKLGTDFDVYLRNFDGSRGDQIYEGFYNEDYTFDQGFYDYEHPAIREFDPPLAFPAGAGLIVEISYVNNGPNTVFYGLTTEDEMGLAYYQLFKGEFNWSGVEDATALSPESLILPNPTSDFIGIRFNLDQADEVLLELYDMSGKLVRTQNAGLVSPGSQLLQLSAAGLASGRYTLALTTQKQGVSRLPVIVAH